MLHRIFVTAGMTMLLVACATPQVESDLESVPPRPNLAMMGPGPVLAISAPQYCPGVPLRMIYYPFTDAERVKLAAHADCLKRHPKQQALLRVRGGESPAQVRHHLEGISAAFAEAGVPATQWRSDSSSSLPGGRSAVEVVYPAAIPD